MNILHEILGVGLLAGAVLVVAAGGLATLFGMGGLERRLVPARVEEGPAGHRRPGAG